MNRVQRHPKFQCGECNQAVKSSHDAISCDICSCWFHKACSMKDAMFDTYTKNSDLEWVCYKCGIPNPDSILFDSSYSSSTSSETFYIPREKAKTLIIATCNFQSIWNKRAELEHFLKKYDIDWHWNSFFTKYNKLWDYPTELFSHQTRQRWWLRGCYHHLQKHTSCRRNTSSSKLWDCHH